MESSGRIKCNALTKKGDVCKNRAVYSYSDFYLCSVHNSAFLLDERIEIITENGTRVVTLDKPQVIEEEERNILYEEEYEGNEIVNETRELPEQSTGDWVFGEETEGLIKPQFPLTGMENISEQDLSETQRKIRERFYGNVTRDEKGRIVKPLVRDENLRPVKPTPIQYVPPRGFKQDPENIYSMEFKKLLSSLPEDKIRKYIDTFTMLNQYIRDSVRGRSFIDTNYIFGVINNGLRDIFNDYFTGNILIPVLRRIEQYNDSGYGMENFISYDLAFKIYEPDKKIVLFQAAPKNVLHGTGNKVTFENIPDGSQFSELMGIYKRLDYDFPSVTLSFNKDSLTNKFTCSQQILNEIKKIYFQDINKAREFSIRGGYYLDEFNKKEEPSFWPYENKIFIKSKVLR